MGRLNFVTLEDAINHKLELEYKALREYTKSINEKLKELIKEECK